MRIVHYYRDLLRSSGVTHAIREWQSACEKAGQVTIALHNGDGDDVWDLPNEQAKHIGRGRQLQIPLLHELFKVGDVLVLHEGWVTSNIIAAASARRHGVPYVMVPHGVYEPTIIRDLKQPRVIRSWFESRMIRKASAIHVFHEPEQAVVTAVSSARSFIIAPTGYNLSPGTKWKPGGAYLAWFGRYSVEHKGIDLMLAAYAMIPPHQRLPLHMHGSDYEGGLAETIELVLAFGLTDWVTVGGSVYGDDKLNFLLGSAGLLFPSRWESHSIALLEALSLGMPILLNKSIHIASALATAGAVETVDYTDMFTASSAITQLTTRIELSLLAQRFVTSDLNWDRILPTYLSQVRALRP